MDDPLRGIRRMAWASAAATLLLIAMGGLVRATDSGLACPDWPACYGQWIPPADVNIWLEHSHRLWAGVVGCLILALTLWTFLRRSRAPGLSWLSALALLLVVAQAGLGAAVVLAQLRPVLVTSHLGMSLVIVACLVVVAVRARSPGAEGRAVGAGNGHTTAMTVQVSEPARQRVGRWATLAAGVVFGQAMLGGQATGHGAAYVFNAVPIWLTDDSWSGSIREILHITHRAAGYLVALIVIGLAIATRRRHAVIPTWVCRLSVVALALVLLQVGLGVANVLTQATVVVAVAHLAVASWLWAALVATAALGAPSAIGSGPPRAAVRAPLRAHTPATSTDSGAVDGITSSDRTEVGT